MGRAACSTRLFSATPSGASNVHQPQNPMRILQPVSRRVMLRGAGASLCLPLLESFGASKAVAATGKAAALRNV